MIENIPAPKFDKRNPQSHKGNYGTALAICGSYGMAGAAIISGKGCLLSGVGILKCALPKKIYPIVSSVLPEAIFVPMDFLSINRKLKKALKGSNAVLFGCGVGKNLFAKKVLKFLIKNCSVPLIIDADGINLLAQNINMLRRAKSTVILTPHPAEMARLTGGSVATVEQDRIFSAGEFAKQNNVYLVLKGHKTIVADPTGKIALNTTGNAGMATGGSGDALAGIMLSLLAQKKDIFRAVCDAVYIHGAAGDKAAERLGQTSMLPSDLIEELPCLYKNFEG